MTDIPTYPRTLTHEVMEHSEGPVARDIEQQTAKMPSDAFLWAAVGAMGTSAILQMTGRSSASRFIGQWVAPMLLFGVYNKLVKQHGSDRLDSGADPRAV